MRLLSIDPAVAKPQAYARFDDGQLVGFGMVSLHELGDLIEDVDEVCCEGQWSGPSARETIALSHVAGRIMQMSEDRDRHCELIPPTQWQGRVLRAGPGVKQLERKRRSRFYARALAADSGFDKADCKSINSDVADAICMGLHYSSTLQIKRRVSLFDRMEA